MEPRFLIESHANYQAHTSDKKLPIWLPAPDKILLIISIVFLQQPLRNRTLESRQS